MAHTYPADHPDRRWGRSYRSSSSCAPCGLRVNRHARRRNVFFIRTQNFFDVSLEIFPVRTAPGIFDGRDAVFEVSSNTSQNIEIVMNMNENVDSARAVKIVC
jgi:hypothetical protein